VRKYELTNIVLQNILLNAPVLNCCFSIVNVKCALKQNASKGDQVVRTIQSATGRSS